MAKLDVAIDASKAKRGAREFTAAMQTMRGGIGQTTNSMVAMGTSAKGLGAAIAAAGLAAGAFATGIGLKFARVSADMVTMAGDAEEVRSKFNAVFKKEAPQTLAFFEKLGDAVGRNITDLQEYAGGIQDIIVPMGMARDEAARLTETMVQLSLDVASFNDAQDVQVIDNFKSALVGESESVKKYGIMMSEARIKQFAFNTGISDGTRALTNLEKVQARVGILFNDTADAQGDLLATQGSFNNQVKRLNAGIKTLKETMGAELITAILSAVDEFGGMNAVLEDIGEGLGVVKDVSIETIPLILDLASAVTNLYDAAKNVPKVLNVGAWQLKLLTGAIKGVGSGISWVTGNYKKLAGATAGAWSEFFNPMSKGFETVEKSAIDAADGISEVADKYQGIVELIDRSAAIREQGLEFNIEGLAGDLARVADEADRIEFDKQHAQLEKSIDLFGEMSETIQSQLVKSFDQQRDAADDAHSAFVQYTAGLADADDLTDPMANDLQAMSVVLRDQSKAAIQAAEDWQKLSDAQEGAIQFAQDHRIAVNTMADAVGGMSQAIGDAAVGFGDFGEMAEDALKRTIANLIAAQVEALFLKALMGFSGLIGGAASVLSGSNAAFSAKGNTFSDGHVEHFAKGGFPTGLISSLTSFPLAGGVGFAGERGPEAGFSSSSAIAPLKRDPVTGELGVRQVGGGGRFSGAVFNFSTTINAGGGRGGGIDQGMRRSVRHYERDLRTMGSRIGA